MARVWTFLKPATICSVLDPAGTLDRQNIHFGSFEAMRVDHHPQGDLGKLETGPRPCGLSLLRTQIWKVEVSASALHDMGTLLGGARDRTDVLENCPDVPKTRSLTNVNPDGSCCKITELINLSSLPVQSFITWHLGLQ